MKAHPSSPLLLCLAAAFTAHTAEASGTMVKLVVGSANVRPSTAFAPGASLKTGSKSYSELAMDHGVVRAGSNTTLRSAGKDEVTLDRGLALVAAQSKFFRPTVVVDTPKHRFQVRGTAQIYHEPGKALRVVVIEGKMTISLNSMSGESVTLRAGQALVVNPVESSLPEPLEIDLDRLIASAELVAGRQFEALPTRDLVANASSRQTSERQRDSRDSDALGRDNDDPHVDSRVEDLIHAEVADEIDDLDGDGEEDDFDGEDDDGDDDGDDADADDDGGDEGDGGGDGGDGGGDGE